MAKPSKIFAMAITKEYGGLGYDAMRPALVLEAWGYGCAGMGTTLAASILLIAESIAETVGPFPITGRDIDPDNGAGQNREVVENVDNS